MARIFDFHAGTVRWITPAASHGIWRVAAIATTDGGDSSPGLHALGQAVMAGDVYGKGLLPLQPAYAFQIIAASAKHTILREGAGARGDTTAPNSEVFSELSVDIPEMDAREIDPARHQHEIKSWPLTARIDARDFAGVSWRLEFPVNHFNYRNTGPGQNEFQIETGPVIVPRALLVSSAGEPTDGFALAYVYCNDVQRVDLAILQPGGRAPAGCEYGRVARLERIKLSLFA